MKKIKPNEQLFLDMTNTQKYDECEKLVTKESLIDCDGDCEYGTLGRILTGKFGMQKDIVDWSKVEVDTIIEVNNEGYWLLRRFAEYKNGKVYCFMEGLSSGSKKETIYREYARLLERKQY